MITENKKYLIDGFAVLTLLDIVRNLKLQVEANYKKFSKNDFIAILKGYDNTIGYLVNLKHIDLNEGITDEEKAGIHEKYVRSLLQHLNIPIQDGDSNEKRREDTKN